MFRLISEKDKEIFLKYTYDFYQSDVVFAPVPQEICESTFTELMRSNQYLECYIFEEDNSPCGYALISKTFSPEAGGLSITYEELYLEEKSRNKGYMSEFFDYIRNKYKAARYRIEVENENEEAKRLYIRQGFMELPYIQMVDDSWRKNHEES